MNRLRRLLPVLITAIITTHTAAATLEESFTQGVEWGRSGNASAKAGINAQTATTTVPGYTTSTPMQSYFGGAGLGGPAATAAARCAATPNDTACQAVNYSQSNPAVRPSFTIAPGDPLLTRAKPITADPAAIAGNIAGTYSACTIQSVTSPDIFSNRICNEYRYLEQHSCTRTLTVTATDQGLSCNPGNYLTPSHRILYIRPYVFVGAVCAEDIRFQWQWGYSECNGTNATIVNISVMPGPQYQRQIVSLGCGGAYYVEGSCLNDSCSYVVGLPNAQPVCTQPCDDGCCAYDYVDTPLAGFAFQRPVHRFSYSDAWDNQCAIWEARLP